MKNMHGGVLRLFITPSKWGVRIIVARNTMYGGRYTQQLLDGFHLSLALSLAVEEVKSNTYVITRGPS